MIFDGGGEYSACGGATAAVMGGIDGTGDSTGGLMLPSCSLGRGSGRCGRYGIDGRWHGHDEDWAGGWRQGDLLG